VIADSDKKPVRLVTRVKGDKRSLQYYALRTRFAWTMSGKSRCWATVMKAAWGNDLDAITLLGIEPKPVERDWRRFDETRELVDLGRNKKIADELLAKLKSEAGAEEDLRHTAERNIAHELDGQMDGLIASAKQYGEKFIDGVKACGVSYALRMNDADDAVKSDLVSLWAVPLKDALETETRNAEDSHIAAKTVISRHLEEISAALLDGNKGAPSAWDPIGKAAVAFWCESAVKWRKILVDRTKNIERIEEARLTLLDRKRERDLDKLTRAAGGVSGVQGAP
jgi:hypothetical protein